MAKKKKPFLKFVCSECKRVNYFTRKSKGMIDEEYWLSDRQVPMYTAENSYAKLEKWEKFF